MKLYHYVHCPFCLRVRMSLGYLKLPFESIVLPYDDEETPLKLTAKKMLPIFQFADGKTMNESLDIIQSLDLKDQLQFNFFKLNEMEVSSLLNKIGEDVHSLCMPYWIWTPEFSNNSRKYFQEKKELKRGPFKNLIKHKDKYIHSLNNSLTELEKKLNPFYLSSHLTIVDIMIASHLWGMFIFPEFQFSNKMYSYLMTIKDECNFDYHADFWK